MIYRNLRIFCQGLPGLFVRQLSRIQRDMGRELAADLGSTSKGIVCSGNQNDIVEMILLSSKFSTVQYSTVQYTAQID